MTDNICEALKQWKQCDPCNVSDVMSGVEVKKKCFCGGGLDIFFTININDAQIFLRSMLESQRQNLFQKIQLSLKESFDYPYLVFSDNKKFEDWLPFQQVLDR